MAELASDVMQRAKAAIAAGGSEEVPQAGAHMARRTNMACPTCDLYPLIQNPGAVALVCQGNSEHRFDMAQVIELKEAGRIRTIAGPDQNRKAPQPQPNAIPVQLMIHQEIVSRLKARFGERLTQSIAEVLTRMAEGDSFSVSTVDVNRLSDLLEQKITNAGVLFGAIFAIKEELVAAREELKELRKRAEAVAAGAGAVNPNAVPVVLSPGTRAKFEDNARFNKMPLGEYVSQELARIVLNGWLDQ